MSQELAAKLGCTPQQALLASLVSQGFTYGEIAGHFQTSETAIQERVRRVCVKLHCRNKTHLAYTIGKLS